MRNLVGFRRNGKHNFYRLDSTFVATQHADGLWYSQPHQSRDTAAGTVSAASFDPVRLKVTVPDAAT